MARKVTRCPVCDSGLVVTELRCGKCHTRLAGEFDSCRFCRLASEHLEFLETFLRCDGNLSRVEKVLGISYPTVRNRFTAMLAALELDSTAAVRAAEDHFERRRAVLQAIERGAMNADEAAVALRGLM